MKVQCQICEAQWEQTEELDRQALREERQAFGRNAHASQRVVLCDDCYAEFMQWWRSLSEKERARIDREAAAREPS